MIKKAGGGQGGEAKRREKTVKRKEGWKGRKEKGWGEGGRKESRQAGKQRDKRKKEYEMRKKKTIILHR